MLSLVIPVYRNEQSIPGLLEIVDGLRERLGGRLEAVFVVDGSPDGSLRKLSEGLGTARFPAQLVVLSRNFGSFSAIVAGLRAARGDLFAVMAADLQEPPELILEFHRVLASGDADVVVGTREERSDSLASRFWAALFWFLYRSLVQPDVPKGGVDVFGCTKRFRDHLLSLQERNSTLVGLVFWLGFRRVDVPYRRRPRPYGRSAWSPGRKLRYLLDSIFAFSDLPVRVLWMAGLLGVGLSLVLGGIVLVMRMLGNVPVPGYTATVLVVMFFGGLNSLGIGLLGEYLWRTFENTKKRPSFVVASTVTYGPDLETEEPATGAPT
jgi:glycosyltransferase involved in cell wall biosynthesis